MSDTPRTDEQINGKPCTQFGILAGDSLRNASVPSEFARTIERELNEANKRIKQLEEWYEHTVLNCYCRGSEVDATRDAWRKAKKDKP